MTALPEDSHPTIVIAAPRKRASGGTNSPESTTESPTPNDHASAAGLSPHPDQASSDTQVRGVGVGDNVHILRQPTRAPSAPISFASAAGPLSAPDPTITGTTPSPGASGRVADSILALLADQLSDAEASRIAAENRLRSLTETWEHDGITYGKGVPKALPEVAVLAAHVDGLHRLEHKMTLALRKAMRAHPLGPWGASIPGVGEKQFARLLACIGDPATRDTPSQLWAYCGYHVLHPSGQTARDTHHDRAGGVAPSRRKGTQVNWSTEAKMRVYLIAESCIKQVGGNGRPRSSYRDVYETGRIKYAESTHNHPCVRCGPSGKPAQPGSDLSDGHKHARAMRLTSKRILLDLWKHAKETTT